MDAVKMFERKWDPGIGKFTMSLLLIYVPVLRWLYEHCSIYHSVKKGQKRHCTGFFQLVLLSRKLIDINIQVSGKTNKIQIQTVQ